MGSKRIPMNCYSLRKASLRELGRTFAKALCTAIQTASFAGGQPRTISGTASVTERTAKHDEA